MKTKILIPRSMNFNRAGAEVTKLVCLVRILALACLLVAAPATAQVNYAVSGNTAYVAYSPNASGDIELLEGSHLQVHVNWGHEAMGRQIRNQKSEITNRQLWRKEPDLNSTARSMLGVS